MEFTRVAADAESAYLGQMLWALLAALSDDDLGSAARAQVARSRFVLAGFGDVPLALVDAVTLGRQGHGDEAAAVVTTALAAVGTRSWSWYALRLTAEAAVRDGWGEPAGWLVRRRRSSRTAVTTGSPGSAGPCSSPPVRRHPPRTGPVAVPPALRRLGITSRELDVLILVADAPAHPRDRRPAVPLPTDRRAPRRQPAGPHRLALPDRARRLRPRKPGRRHALTG